MPWCRKTRVTSTCVQTLPFLAPDLLFKARSTFSPPKSQSSQPTDTHSKHPKHLNAHVPPCPLSSPGTFSATCESMQHRGQDWNVPVSQFIPKCPAQGQAEHHKMGQVIVDPLQNQADNTSFLTQQKAPHNRGLRKANMFNQSRCSFCLKKKKKKKSCPLLELKKKISDHSMIGADFSHGQRLEE